MKILLSSVLALSLVVVAHATTYTTFTITNASGGITTVTTTNNGSVWGDVVQLGSDALSRLSALDFSQGIKVAPVFLIHPTSGKTEFGGGLMAETAMTNGVNYGFGAFALTEMVNGKREVKFYDGSLNLQLGHVFINTPSFSLYAYAETGPATDLSNPTVLYVQSFSGFDAYFGSSKRFAIGAGVGNCTKWSSDVLGEGHISYSF